MTATPCRRDGRGLGGTFNALVECPQIEQLIEMGFLVRTRVWAPTTPDLRGVHTNQGDYVLHELADRVDRPELVGDIVTHWHRLGERRKTVVFATSVAHSIHLKDEFVKSGVRAEHIDGKTPKEERDEILRRLSTGDLELVTNCMVLTEGVDMPSVSCCVLARPTKSMGLYRQMAGRVIRPFPGKPDALILDHAGATLRHGFVEDPVRWTLDPDTKAETPAHEARNRTDLASRLVACTKCSAIRTAGKACPECGHLPQRPGEYMPVREGELAYLDRERRLHPNHYAPAQKDEYYAMLLHLCLQRGNNPNAAAHRFRERFGIAHSQHDIETIPPDAEVRDWDLTPASNTPRVCKGRRLMAKWSKKKRAAWRAGFHGDIAHALVCCQHGRLPPQHIAYLTSILKDPSSIPKPAEIGTAIGLTYEQQQQNKLYSIPPADKTKAELKALHLAKDAVRQERFRRKHNQRPREAYRAAVKSKEPWLALGMTKPTYYRKGLHRERPMAGGETGCVTGG